MPVLRDPLNQRQLADFMESQRGYSINNNAVIQAYHVASTMKDQHQKDSLEQVLMDMNGMLRRSIKDYALAHPSSYVSALELYLNFSYNPDAGQLDSAFNGLDSSIRVSYFGKKVNETVQNVKRTAIAAVPPPISR